MAGPNLPINVDTTYADSTADASVKTHQQHHDSIHTIINRFDLTPPTVGQTVIASAGASWVYANSVTSPTGPQRVWVRTLAQGFPTAGDGALDGDLLFIDNS